jgi:hypothetical protein
MARVCRVAHYNALPVVWEHVRGVHNLLRLLPGVEVSEYEPSNFKLVSFFYLDLFVTFSRRQSTADCIHRVYRVRALPI